MATRVAINGFGRIGRLVARAILERADHDLELVSINDLAEPRDNALLFQFDSTHGRFPGSVTSDGDSMQVNGRDILVTKERDPGRLPHKAQGIDIVLECTGFFQSDAASRPHLDAGARRVLISAPADGVSKTIVFGVNQDSLTAEDVIVSNASCTTNCLVPVVKVVLDNFGFVNGFMTTVHSYTNDQQILDLPHKDLRRARAAALSIIPTTTGAAKATSLVLPEVKGKLDGVSLRVPTSDVSVVDLTCTVTKSTSIEEVNAAFRAAADGALKGVLAVSDEPLVSVDYIGNLSSSTVDLALTNVLDGTLVHVSSWYDNEMGYSARCVDLMRYIGGRF